MDHMQFRRASLRAQARAKVDPQHSNYWHGYQQGLHRARLGQPSGSDAEHNRWLTLKFSRDASLAARGAGYRDALALLAATVG